MIRVAIAGLGFMGKTHLGVYQRLANAEVTALFDQSPKAFDISASDSGGNIRTSSGGVDLHNVRTYTSFDTMLSNGGFDVVDVTLPTFLHAEYCTSALKAGYHVFCEKPLSLDGASADLIVRKVQETKKLFGVGHCLRFWPAYVETKKLIDSGVYGRVRHAEFARLSQRPAWGWSDWFKASARSGGAGLDLHIHDVDLVLWHFGLPESLRSVGVSEKDGGISHVCTVYRYPDLSVMSEGGWICSKSFGFNMRALYVLEGATIELDFSKNPIVTVAPENGDKYPLALAPEDGYFYELEDFLRAVESGKPSAVATAQSSALAVKLCTEELRSVRENREIQTSGLL